MSILAQISESEDAIFQVEFEQFKPSNQDQIREFEGKAPMQFLAPDVNGEEQFLGNFKGKTVFVYFFNQQCGICKEQVSAFNLMQEEKGNDLKIIAIGDGSKEELKTYQETHGINYSVLYNGKMLGEAAYGIEMGYPRLFVLDDEGIARHVLPEEAFVEASKTYLMLENLYKLVNSK
ncbi:hypothetical protein GCM10007940_12430 [Portibacter lacus]|uniref:Thioredoxin domain-containing protein n=2 Tax=Portibacter lacus TaxID=1099794 RepID=A0AA37SLB4_9BACT|nr:hypothetical protein GCM10007940_12430 [Portibacter lacus]